MCLLDIRFLVYLNNVRQQVQKQPNLSDMKSFEIKSKFCAILLSGILMLNCNQTNENVKTGRNNNSTNIRANYAIAIHGGAGTILKKNMTPEKEENYTNALDSALALGEKMLKDGKDGLDVIESVIIQLENNPLFNAGKGAVLNNEGKNELDASIMEGANQNAGAVGGVTNLKNPIRAARAVMEQSKHVMLVGKGAEKFAADLGHETVPPDYFLTEKRIKSLEKAKAKEKATGSLPLHHDFKFGTVGCVVLDQKGNLAAGTSTGGMTNKRWNRIGDSPIIGAGTYANNQTCAVSSTGHGEYFIRYAVAYDISARMEYLGESLSEAANHVINKKLVEKGGSGGIIAVDKLGNFALPHNSPGMYRAWATPDERGVRIYGDEEYQ